MTSPPNIARYVMIGGFLGAGKTTAVDRFAEELTGRGLRVGLITNDQSTGLVDTRLLRSRGFEVEEIAGALTPVPGGVGPLTISMLLSNTVRAAELRRARSDVGDRGTVRAE